MLARLLWALVAAIGFAGAVHASAPAEVSPLIQTLPSLPEGRLSDAALPLAYRLDLTIDPAQPRFSGKAEIDIELKQASHVIFLHGRDLAMLSATARIGGKDYPGRWHQADASGVAVLTFAKPLPAGRATLLFDYGAAFNDSPAGLFRVKVGDHWYSWSQFQSIDARLAFPGFDDPGFKTPFTVTLRTPPGLTAIANAAQVSKSSEGGLDVHRYAPTLPLPTYLVAMMVGPFAVLEGTVPPTPQRAAPLPLRIVTPWQNAGRMDFALQSSKEIVTLLEDWFGDAFPYPKLDQITSPIMPGAMENAGADLYGDSILILDRTAPVAQQRRHGMIVSHELGHQWFGDLVTPGWWDDIWLNESFANWMGYHIGQQWRPGLNIGAGALEEGFEAMAEDALLAGRPIRQDIARNSQIDEAFDDITYGKGGHVVAMIGGFLGAEKFRSGVRSYMAAHRYGNATSTDFFGALAVAAGDPRIVPAMRSFTDQQGVPLLTFGRDGKQWRVSQSRYAPLGVTAPATEWGVPLCLRQGTVRQCSLLAGAAMDLAITGKVPFMPNAGGTGYYRFELPRKQWRALIAMADRLPGSEAQALADSLAASFRAGRAELRDLVALARKLLRNPDSRATAMATTTLAELSRAGLFDEAATGAYRNLIGRLYVPMLDDMGFDPRRGAYASEDPEAAQRRTQVVARLAASGHHPALRRALSAAANGYLGGRKDALDPAWMTEAFDVLITTGGFDAAKELLGKALASQDPDFRPAALDAIGTSGSETISRWLLDELKDERLRPSEFRSMLAGIVQTKTTRELGYAWLKLHLDELLSGSGGIFFASRMPKWLDTFCSRARADEFARDLRPRFAGKTGALALERTIEKVRNCGMLHEARAAQVSAEMARMR